MFFAATRHAGGPRRPPAPFATSHPPPFSLPALSLYLYLSLYLCLCVRQLYEYLRNRMAAIAPNLTVMVGELVGARLIAHAGSLLNLAKHPASTIQILGAEKVT